MSDFFLRLRERCEAARTNLCVGLDPVVERMPKSAGEGAAAVEKFCIEIIEAVGESAAAFKPNIAFFEALGTDGWSVLKRVLAAVPMDVPVILDAKRGDIGSTGELYAKSLFEVLNADAVTVSPYLGRDGVEPFFKYSDRGVYVLCLTSNPGSADFQLPGDLYLRVARAVASWNAHGNLGMVVGATRAEHLHGVREAAPEIPLLIPGVGAQGGDLRTVMRSGAARPLHETLINVSRSVLYASDGTDFAEAAAREAEKTRLAALAAMEA